MVNPFQVPETEPGSAEPLCPWRAGVHETYYVDVDNTGAAHRTFLDQMDSLPGLHTRGRLVVVTGDDGCGKTSLIHRCAYDLDKKVNPPVAGAAGPVKPSFILDLSGYEYRPGVARSGDGRLREICEELKRRIVETNLFALPSGNGIESDSRNFYRWLATEATNARSVLIILLPPVLDFVDELGEYSFLARSHARIVFLTESSDVTVVSGFVAGEQARGNLIVQLTVRPIGRADGYKFARARIDRHAPGTVAPVDRDEMDQAMEEMELIGPVSIRRMQSSLHSVWEEREGDPNPRRILAVEILGSLVRYDRFRERT